MIRRGVLSTGAHIYLPPVSKKQQQSPVGGLTITPSRSTNSSTTSSSGSGKNASPPSWLTAGSTATAKIGSGLTNLRESVQGGLARAAKIRAVPQLQSASTQTDPYVPAVDPPALPPPIAGSPAAAPPRREPPTGGPTAGEGLVNTQLSERLLDLADALAKADPLAPATGRSDISSVLFSLSPGAAAPSGTADAVARMRLLADVASGLMSIGDYDRSMRTSGLRK